MDKMKSVNDKLSRKAAEVFGTQNLNNLLDKAIYEGLHYYGETEYIVAGKDGHLKMTGSPEGTEGKLVVYSVTFTEKDTRNFLTEVAPDLVPQMAKPEWRTFYGAWSPTDERILRYPNYDPIGYGIMVQDFADVLNDVAENWF